MSDHVVSKYVPPEASDQKQVVVLAQTDILSASVQVIGKEGETNLHAHTAADEYWLVLKGQAKFYGEGNVVTADLGKCEGVLIPRGSPYWFESVGDEPLEIFRAGATHPNVRRERIDYTPMTESTRVAREQMAQELAKRGQPVARMSEEGQSAQRPRTPAPLKTMATKPFRLTEAASN